MTTRLLTLIIKEFKAIWKDPRSRMIVTIMPIIQLIVFANAVTMEVKNIDMLVLDNSRSYYSRELISHFANSPWFNSVAVVDTPEQLKQSIDIQKASLAMEIPPDFAVSIKNKTGASVQLTMSWSKVPTSFSRAIDSDVSKRTMTIESIAIRETSE